jgi:glutathione reductase (NADPH)
VKAVAGTPEGYRVAAQADGQTKDFEADLAIHAAGRVPNLAGLDLEKDDVAVESGRLQLKCVTGPHRVVQLGC